MKRAREHAGTNTHRQTGRQQTSKQTDRQAGTQKLRMRKVWRVKEPNTARAKKLNFMWKDRRGNIRMADRVTGGLE